MKIRSIEAATRRGNITAVQIEYKPDQGQYTKFERVGRGRTLEVPGIPNATVKVNGIIG